MGKKKKGAKLWFGYNWGMGGGGGIGGERSKSKFDDGKTR